MTDGKITGNPVNPKILNQMNDLIVEVLTLKQLYLDGDLTSAYEQLTKIADTGGDICDKLGDEQDNDFDYEAFKNLPPKNPDLQLKRKS